MRKKNKTRRRKKRRQYGGAECSVCGTMHSPDTECPTCASRRKDDNNNTNGQMNNLTARFSDLLIQNNENNVAHANTDNNSVSGGNSGGGWDALFAESAALVVERDAKNPHQARERERVMEQKIASARVKYTSKQISAGVKKFEDRFGFKPGEVDLKMLINSGIEKYIDDGSSSGGGGSSSGDAHMICSTPRCNRSADTIVGEPPGHPHCAKHATYEIRCETERAKAKEKLIAKYRQRITAEDLERDRPACILFSKQRTLDETRALINEIFDKKGISEHTKQFLFELLEKIKDQFIDDDGLPIPLHESPQYSDLELQMIALNQKRDDIVKQSEVAMRQMVKAHFSKLSQKQQENKVKSIIQKKISNFQKSGMKLAEAAAAAIKQGPQILKDLEKKEQEALSNMKQINEKYKLIQNEYAKKLQIHQSLAANRARGIPSGLRTAVGGGGVDKQYVAESWLHFRKDIEKMLISYLQHFYDAILKIREIKVYYGLDPETLFTEQELQQVERQPAPFLASLTPVGEIKRLQDSLNTMKLELIGKIIPYAGLSGNETSKKFLLPDGNQGGGKRTRRKRKKKKLKRRRRTRKYRKKRRKRRTRRCD